MSKTITNVRPWGEFHIEDIVRIFTLSGNFVGHIDDVRKSEMGEPAFIRFTELDGSQDNLILEYRESSMDPKTTYIRIDHITAIFVEFDYRDNLEEDEDDEEEEDSRYLEKDIEKVDWWEECLP